MLLAVAIWIVLSQSAFAAGSEAPTPTTSLDCHSPVGSSAVPRRDVTSVGGAVALQTSASTRRAIQTTRDPAAVPALPYRAKSPLFVRTRRTAQIRIPDSERGHVAITWGNTDHDGIAESVFTVGRCSGQAQWIVFPGSFFVDRPHCIKLVVRVWQRSRSTHGRRVALSGPASTDATKRHLIARRHNWPLGLGPIGHHACHDGRLCGRSLRPDRRGLRGTSTTRSSLGVSATRGARGRGRTVLNVGAGAGSYEPRDRQVCALEPSLTMIKQRSADAAPAVRGSAEALPFPDRTFDAALAIFTVHHWSDPALGLAELQRVSKHQVVVTWNPSIFSERMWLVSEYLPEVYEREATLATESTVLDLLDHARSAPLLVPFDLTDGVLGVYWRRPEAFLDPLVRLSNSGMALLDPRVVQRAVEQLEQDLLDGSWHRRHQDLSDRIEIDLGYRIVVARSE